MLCPIIFISNTTELAVYTSCYLGLRLTLCYNKFSFHLFSIQPSVLTSNYKLQKEIFFSLYIKYMKVFFKFWGIFDPELDVALLCKKIKEVFFINETGYHQINRFNQFNSVLANLSAKQL